ncbi:MAG: protein kinase, partial [Lachnospiraceae bacterium]|nr:protein kinase [Lachnospiraceae bacterium]
MREGTNMQDLEKIQAQWPGWRVVRKLGQGGFGAVYEIERDVLGETEKAALKTISIPQNDDDIEELKVEGYDDATITKRFHSYLENIVKEYSTMAKLKGHPNVVYCDDIKYIQHDDGFGWDIFIRMELLTPIMQCLDKIDNEESAIDLGIAISNALAACANHNIIHRDIKPQNIFMSSDGTFKLGDFGIAKTVE